MTQAAASPDGYEITHWERRNRLDDLAIWLKDFGYRHRATLGYVLIVALTLGLMIPYVPAMLSPIGIVLTLAAIAPITVVMFLFWRSARGHREPVGLLLKTFLLGASFAVVAALVNTQLGYLPDVVKYLLVVGPGEEVVKLAAVYVLAFHRRDFDRPVDGIYYGVAAGAGFAALENIMYVFNAGFTGGFGAAMQTAIVRALVSTPGHAIWTGFAGYYL
ncbi:MAG TPA: PrsW family intramembrane metalloprotease, partial [Candidatus Thermoplasmatota archaeon]|nr:PrsW family intramembrane metalloprotease [Candidatus Thermoplasmatota archaeon]